MGYMDIECLVSFGLTPTEARIYQEIVKLKETEIGRVIKVTGLHRGTVYNSLERLTRKGFIARKIKENKQIYFPTGQSVFSSILKSKEDYLKKEKEFVNHISKEIMLPWSKLESKEEVTIYRGKEGYESYYKRMVDECAQRKECFLAMGYGGATASKFGVSFFKMLQKYKHLKKVKPRIIMDIRAKKSKIKKNIVGYIKYIPFVVATPASTRIFGDKVSFTLWEAEPPMIIVIKSAELAKGFKNYFESLWKISKG